MAFEKGNTYGNRFNKDKQPKVRKPRGLSKTTSIVEELKRLSIEEITDTKGKTKRRKEVLALKLFAMAMNGDIKAAQLIVDRLDGRAPEEINHHLDGEVKNPMGGGSVINIITNP